MKNGLFSRLFGFKKQGSAAVSPALGIRGACLELMDCGTVHDLSAVFQAVHSRSDVHDHLNVALVGKEVDLERAFVRRVDVQCRICSAKTWNHVRVDIGNLGQWNVAFEQAKSAVQNDCVVRDDDALHGKPKRCAQQEHERRLDGLR